MRRFLLIACVCVLAGAALAAAGVVPRALSSRQSAVAATVNGAEISEDEVTAYIEGFRSENVDYENDTGWASFLSDAGYTAEGLRHHVLDTVFIPEALVRQECAARDIVVTDKDLESLIAQEKSYYEKRYGKDSWDSVLASYGYDAASWRDNEEDRLLEKKLIQAVVEVGEPGDDAVQVAANEKASAYNGRHSLYLDFATAEEAQGARERLVAGGAEGLSREAFAALSADPQAVKDAGWSSLPEDRAKMSNAYTKALQGLSAGAASEPFEDDGVWRLVLCDEVFEVGRDEEFVSLERIPSPIVDQLRADTLQSERESAFESWLSDVRSRASVVVSDMPDGLSYDVDVPLEQTLAGVDGAAGGDAAVAARGAGEAGGRTGEAGGASADAGNGAAAASSAGDGTAGAGAAGGKGR